MDGPSPAPDFPVSRCAPCGRDVLTHVRVDPAGAERRHCLHCDAEIDPGEIRWVLEPELERLGYAFQAAEMVGGCGRPGCGQGRCGRD
jgi:hypothetical protein